ncbi:MAG: hypothetical protein ACRDYE_11125 [Acidimicrobiales bacterium]
MTIGARDAAVVVMMTLLADYRYHTLRTTTAELAARLSMSPRTVGKAQAVLLQHMLISWTARPGRNRVAIVHLDRYDDLVVPERGRTAGRRAVTMDPPSQPELPDPASNLELPGPGAIPNRKALGYFLRREIDAGSGAVAG